MKKLFILTMACMFGLFNSLNAQSVSKDNVTREIQCDAPEGLYGEYVYNEDGTYGTNLNLIYTISEWMFYDNGNFASAMGYVDPDTQMPGTLYWAVMFPAETMSEFAGYELTKISMYFYEEFSGVFSIYAGGDDAPETLIHSQEYSTSECDKFVEFELTKPVVISGTENIWVQLCNHSGSMVAAYSLDSGDPNARWMSNDGENWYDIADYYEPGWYGSWMLRACVESSNGTEKAMLSPMGKESAFDHYNVYRGTTNDNYELVGETAEMPYFDELTEEGTYYYQVTAVYNENGEECESDPATAYEDPSQDYIVVEVVSVVENNVEGLMVYPNPTQGNLNITAESMTRVTITNSLGQVISDQPASNDNMIVDMSQYEAGIYMVRVETEEGIAVQRVVVL